MFGWFGNSYQRKRQQVHETLRDYPVYSPPYRGYPTAHKNARENFDHFLKTENERKNYIESYLRKINIPIGTTPAEINAIGRWLRDYGGYFIPLSFLEQHDAQSLYDPEWRGDFAGLNVINDLAIMVGEMVIARKPTARWRMFGLSQAEKSYYENLPKEEEYVKDDGEDLPHYLLVQNLPVDDEQDDEGIEGMPGYLQPCLYGVRRGLQPVHVIGAMTEACQESQFYLRGLTKTSGQWIQKTALLDYIEHFSTPDS